MIPPWISSTFGNSRRNLAFERLMEMAWKPYEFGNEWLSARSFDVCMYILNDRQ